VKLDAATRRAVDGFFADRAEARRLFRAFVALVDDARVRVTKSQIAFAGRRQFAWAWTPGRWLRGAVAPLVVSVALPRRDRSRRWKEIAEPRPGRFVHHLEVWSRDDLDAELAGWLDEAAADADGTVS